MIAKVAAALAALIFANSVLADDDQIILAQAPYPDGYTKPVRRPSDVPHLSNEWKGDPIPFCAFFDIGKNGAVSNVHVILSTGSEATDGVFVRWLNQQQYIPAAINGKAIKVRNLFGWSIGQMPPEKSNYCNWTMYHPDI